jgi:hypothetical protein
MASLIDVNTIVPPVSEVVADQLINYVNTVKDGNITDVDVGSKMWTFIYTSGRQKVDLYYKLYQFKKQSFVLYATGKHLDLHGQERGVFRLQPNSAEGIATFYRELPAPVELRIPQGLEVTTTADSSDEEVITFVTTGSGIIAPNQLSTEVSIKCTISGESGNLAAGSLNRMPSPPSGVHRVVTTSTTGGTKQETDEDYRARIIVALESLGKGTIAAITNAIMAVQGIRTVSITDPTQIIAAAEYYLENDLAVKCSYLRTLNATIAVDQVTLYITTGSELGTKRLKVWNKDSHDVQVTEDFNNLNDFSELISKISTTKKSYNLTDGTRIIGKFTTIQPEGMELQEIYFDIVDGSTSGLKYTFTYGDDIRTTEVYDNITSVGQLRDLLNSQSLICTMTTYVEYEESLPVHLLIDGFGDEINYVVPTYQPIIALLPDQEDIDGTPYRLDLVDYSSSSTSSISQSSVSSESSASSESSPLSRSSDSSFSSQSSNSSDSSFSSESSESSELPSASSESSPLSRSSESSDSSESSLLSSESSLLSDSSVSSDSSSSFALNFEQKITVFKDTGTVTVGYIYDGVSYSPVKVADKFGSDGSNLISAEIYGEKTGTGDIRKIWEIENENQLEVPVDIGSGTGDSGEYMETVWQVRPGSITVLPVPHALPMSNELKEDVEEAIDEVKAAGIEVIIEEPTVEFVDVSISVGLNLESGADENAIKELIINNLTSYINQLEQDEIAYWERLVAEANPDIEGLLYTEVLSPLSDIHPPTGGFLRAGTIEFG